MLLYFLRSFMPLGVLGLIVSIPYFSQQGLSHLDLTAQIVLHIICLFAGHIVLVSLLVFLCRNIQLNFVKPGSMLLYSLLFYLVLFVSTASIFTQFFWSAPANGIVLAAFIRNFEHYINLLHLNVSQILVFFILISVLVLYILYRGALWAINFYPNRHFRLSRTTWILSLGVGLLFVGVMPGMLKNRDYLRSKVPFVKPVLEYFANSPVLYAGFIWFERSGLRRIVKKEEKDMAKLMGDGRASNPFDKNLILITVDALRADFVLQDSLRKTYMPRLNKRLSNQKHIAFTNAYANCNYSSCGLLSILEGRVSDGVEKKGLSMQQYLKHCGYTTSFIVAGNHAGFDHLDIRYGNFVDYYFEGRYSRYFELDSDKVLIEGLEDWSNKSIGAAPHFLWFHLMSAHYVADREERFKLRRPSEFSFLHENAEGALLNYNNNYRNGVLQSDFYLDTLLNILNTKIRFDKSLIVITSDHGENLSPEFAIGHGRDLNIEQLHIPLVILEPAMKESALDSTFLAQSDIAPLLMKTLEIPIPGQWKSFSKPNEIVVKSQNKKLEGRLFLAEGKRVVLELD